MKNNMKKIKTTYSNDNFCITVNDEVFNHLSVHDCGEPCSGILKHWGTKRELLDELKGIIKVLEDFEN